MYKFFLLIIFISVRIYSQNILDTNTCLLISGRYRQYYSNEKYTEGELKKCKKDGLWKNYYQNELISILKFNNGICQEERTIINENDSVILTSRISENRDTLYIYNYSENRLESYKVYLISGSFSFINYSISEENIAGFKKLFFRKTINYSPFLTDKEIYLVEDEYIGKGISRKYYAKKNNKIMFEFDTKNHISYGNINDFINLNKQETDYIKKINK